ncbi:hypothetical protein [Hymenobacter cavernae]|uniref:Type VI secretion system baseplate subunit TssG n=1 Tax=Hymenobacter cavernae TaxID=2044852 RepID=A0ABQ1UW71_9BACT|nr:hypothetical protein [Hymenobacter cavernae]GGF26598.1 hypothetical protein GCM10011383_42650 [Hymenobacter cavernae]
MSTPTSLSQLFAYLKRQPLDLRLEVVLAELIANGYQFDDFIIRPVSLFARRYRRDIGTFSTERAERWLPTRLAVEVHREGLYDAMPQEIFHHLTDPSPRQDARSVVENIQTQRRKEKAARRFFLPFEQEFYRHRVLLEQEERRYLTNLSTQWYNEMLARFWELHDLGLPPRQITNLLYLLPVVHRIVGDLHLTRLCFESVLENAVRLRTIAPLRHELAATDTGGEAVGATLGQAALGRDLVLGGFYQETLPALEITIESLSAPMLEVYFTDSWQARALQLLCRYFVAFETDVVLHYEVAETAQSFVLSNAGDTAILGYTTTRL